MAKISVPGYLSISAGLDAMYTSPLSRTLVVMASLSPDICDWVKCGASSFVSHSLHLPLKRTRPVKNGFRDCIKTNFDESGSRLDLSFFANDYTNKLAHVQVVIN